MPSLEVFSTYCSSGSDIGLILRQWPFLVERFFFLIISLFLCVSLSVSLSVCLCLSLCISASLCVSVCLSVCLSLSVCVSVFLCLCLSPLRDRWCDILCLSVCLFLSVCLSLSPPLSLSPSLPLSLSSREINGVISFGLCPQVMNVSSSSTFTKQGLTNPYLHWAFTGKQYNSSQTAAAVPLR